LAAADGDRQECTPRDCTGQLSGPGAELGDAGKLAVAYQTSTIAGAAVLEGVAFMNIVTYLVNGSLTPLVVGVCLVLPLAAMFPSAPRVANWIDGQLRLMADEKMLSR
jgi:hypothetical protein